MHVSQYVQGELNEMMKQKITSHSPSNITCLFVCLFVFLKSPQPPFSCILLDYSGK